MRAKNLVVFGTLALLLASGPGAGCTFGGLANYTIQPCEPAKTQADDVCNRLNTGGPSACFIYQCDTVSRRCIQKTRDDDRDGDPPLACGGTDCDDANPARSASTKEICDGVDNNCNGVVDEDAVSPGPERTIVPAHLSDSAEPVVVAADDDHRKLLAAFVASSCIPFVSLEPGGSAGATGCAVLGGENGLAPQQPFPFRSAGGDAAAFVETTACPGGRLSYRFGSASTARIDVSCDAAHPVALPSLAAMPQSANANSGVITWYEAPRLDRGEPIGGCATAKAVPFAVLRVQDLTTSPSPSPSLSDVLFSSEASRSTRPAALAAIDAAGGLLAATALGDDVGVWLLTPAALSAKTLAPATHVASLAGAHETALAAEVEAGIAHVALVASTGCSPQATIKLALGQVDSAGKITFGDAIPVAGPAEVATAPSVAWIPTRGEWWVAWLDKANARVQRFSPAGKPIGAVIAVGQTLPLAAVSSAESVFGFDPNTSGGAFVEIPLACPK